MDGRAKKALRKHIGEYLDISHTRMTDEEAELLGDFIDSYEQYRGESFTDERSYAGWGSDGKYRRTETITHTFMDEPGIRKDCAYRDDDGQSDSFSEVIKDARTVLDLLKSRQK